MKKLKNAGRRLFATSLILAMILALGAGMIPLQASAENEEERITAEELITFLEAPGDGSISLLTQYWYEIHIEDDIILGGDKTIIGGDDEGQVYVYIFGNISGDYTLTMQGGVLLVNGDIDCNITLNDWAWLAPFDGDSVLKEGRVIDVTDGGFDIWGDIEFVNYGTITSGRGYIHMYDVDFKNYGTITASGGSIWISDRTTFTNNGKVILDSVDVSDDDDSYPNIRSAELYILDNATFTNSGEVILNRTDVSVVVTDNGYSWTNTWTGNGRLYIQRGGRFLDAGGTVINNGLISVGSGLFTMPTNFETYEGLLQGARASNFSGAFDFLTLNANGGFFHIGWQRSSTAVVAVPRGKLFDLTKVNLWPNRAGVNHINYGMTGYFTAATGGDEVIFWSNTNKAFNGAGRTLFAQWEEIVTPEEIIKASDNLGLSTTTPRWVWFDSQGQDTFYHWSQSGGEFAVILPAADGVAVEITGPNEVIYTNFTSGSFIPSGQPASIVPSALSFRPAAPFTTSAGMTVTSLAANGVRIQNAIGGEWTIRLSGGEPHSDMTVYIAEEAQGWLPPSTNTFNDVPDNRWPNNEVSWAQLNGITKGTSPTTFSPNNNVTRAEFITFLHRIYGSPKVEEETPFRDLPGNVDFRNAISWAYDWGITTGSPSGSDTFHPNRNITREEIAAMLHRLFYNSISIPVDVLGGYTDQHTISTWSGARAAVNWAVYYEIKGVNVATLNPRGNATRAEAITMLYRVVETFMS